MVDDVLREVVHEAPAQLRVVRYFREALAGFVLDLDRLLVGLGDDLLDELHTNGGVTVGATVIIGGLPAGGGAIERRAPFRSWRRERVAAAGTLGGQRDLPVDLPRVAGRMLRREHEP